MKKSFYLDENLSREIGRTLEDMQHRVLSVKNTSLHGASDAVQLEYAATHGLILVTRDADFIALHAESLKSSRPHSGIMRLAGYDSDAATRIIMVAGQHSDTGNSLFVLGPDGYTHQAEGQPRTSGIPAWKASESCARHGRFSKSYGVRNAAAARHTRDRMV